MYSFNINSEPTVAFRPIGKSSAAPLRIEIGLSLLLACTLGYAEQAGVRPELGEHASIANGAEGSDARFEQVSIIVAAIDAPSKRQEVSDNKSQIAVIYPDLGEPYRSIFSKIVEGIQERAKVPVNTYAVGPNSNSADLSAQLRRAGTKVAIALGRQGLTVASGLERDIAIVVGGVLSIPETDSRNMTGISLTPDPALLFKLLKELLPATKRVIVIYDPQHNEWLLKLARESAKAQGVELVSREASDLASAARLYEAVFAAADNKTDAVWLLQDATTVDEETILPLVLKQSWSHSVPVFSSSFLHARKGVLFALSPDNLGLGHDLATSALGVLAGESHKRGVSPLREVLTAVNRRTASHLGLNIDQQPRHFDFVFPEP